MPITRRTAAERLAAENGIGPEDHGYIDAMEDAIDPCTCARSDCIGWVQARYIIALNYVGVPPLRVDSAFYRAFDELR